MRRAGARIAERHEVSNHTDALLGSLPVSHVQSVLTVPRRHMGHPSRACCTLFLLYAVFYAFLFGPFLLGLRVLASGDVETFFLPYFLHHGTWWTPDMFAGYPMLADPQAWTWYPPAMLLPKSMLGWNLFNVLPFLLASTFTAFFLLSLTGSFFPSLLSGVVYGMSSAYVTHLNHPTILHAACWFPLALACCVKLRDRCCGRGLAAFALVVALSGLSGSPQIFLYSMTIVGAYVIFLASGAERPRRYVCCCFGAMLLGFGVSAIQFLPTMELAPRTWRGDIDFEFFTMYSMTCRDLWAICMPGFIGKNSGESAIYLGLLPLILAGVAVVRVKGDAQAWFWLGLSVLAVALALGSNAPFARLMYHIPVYNKFRVPPRHLLSFSLAVSVLCGLGLNRLRAMDAEARMGYIRRLLAVCASIMVLCYLIQATLYAGTEQAGNSSVVAGFLRLPLQRTSVRRILIVALMSFFVLYLWGRWRNAWTHVLVLSLTVLDIGLAGIFFHDIHHDAYPPLTALNKPALLKRHDANALPDGYRILTYAGVHADMEQGKPNTNLYWNLSNVSGYNPMMLGRYKDLLEMDSWGTLDPRLFAGAHRGLDILSARYIFLPSGAIDPSRFFWKDGVIWDQQDMNLQLSGRPHRKIVQEVTLHVPDIPATGIAFVTGLHDAADVLENRPVLRMTVQTTSGETFVLRAKAGPHTSDWKWNELHRTGRARHACAPVFDSFRYTGDDGMPCTGHRYLGRLPFKRRITVNRIQIAFAGPRDVRLVLFKMTLIDADQAWFKVSPLEGYLADASRWRRIGGTDKTLVFENLRALPRAWLCREVRTLREGDMLRAIQLGALPDGTAYEPRHHALVDAGAPIALDSQAVHGSVRIIKDDQTDIRLEVESDQPAYLVLSDVYYPGWRATLDDRPTRVYRTNYVSRGILVPSGSHRVRFTFRPGSFMYGACVSSLSMAVILLMFLKDAGKTPPSVPA